MTGRISERLRELGLELPEVTPPVAAYVPAVRTGNQVWVSGQLPMADGRMLATGKVGEDEGLVSPENAAALARRCAINALAAVAALLADDGGSLDDVSRIIKLQGFVASAPGFTGQPGVINGASMLLREVFGDAGQHARSAVGVAELPLGAPVELDLVLELVAPS